MKTRMLSWLALPMLLLLSGCPEGDGGPGGTTEGTSAPAVAYVANNGSNNVSGYMINLATGALVAATDLPFAAGTNPTAVAVSPNGAFAFVANSGSSNVSAYTINATTGALTAVAGGAVAAGTTPTAAAVSTNSSFLYVVNQGSNNVSAYAIDAGTGVLTALAGGTGNPFAAGTTPVGIAITPNGAFVNVANSGSNNVSAYSVNIGTGALTALAGGIGNPFAAGTSPSGVATPGRP